MTETSPSFLSTRASPWHLAEGKDEGSMWLAWLMRLRWLAIIAQIVTLSFTFGVLDTPSLVLPGLLVAITVLGVSNAVAVRQLHERDRIEASTLFGHLVLDVLVLTVFFAVTGGAANPFVIIYLIHVAMAAVMMRPRYALGLLGFVVLANAGLHRYALPLHLDRHTLPPPVLLAMGQMIAFSVTAISVAMFVLGMAATLRRQKQRLVEHRDRTAQTDRLRAVGTLAAGAAHELNTPLSTVGLRVRRIARRYDDEATTADLDVIRAQLERCRQIVEQLLVGAGDPTASGFERASLQSFVDGALLLWEKGSTVGVEVDSEAAPVPVELPKVAFTQAFINLLENAREAQEEAGVFDPIQVRVHRDGDLGIVRIADRGPGLPPDSDRVGEPFFTTKPTGTGLGVFVARALADGAGGGLAYLRDGDRTVARWSFALTGRSA